MSETIKTCVNDSQARNKTSFDEYTISKYLQKGTPIIEES